MELEINNKQYPFLFNINTIRTFSRYKNFDKVSEFDAFIVSFSQSLAKKEKDGKDTEMSWEIFDDINMLFYCAIQEGCRKEKIDFDLDKEDLLEHITNNSKDFAKIMEGFTEELPTGNVTAPNKKTGPKIQKVV